MRVVILGAPGSGKGTQCGILSRIYGVPHISTGDLLRAEVAQHSALGEKARGYMEAGELVPDDVILEMVEERLKQPDARRGWLMDGFPRTLEQAEALAALTERLGQDVDVAVILDVAPEVIVQRLSGRKREDDAPDVVRKRIAVFEEQTRPVFDFFRKHYDVLDVDASRSIDEVTEALRRGLDGYDHS